MQMFTSKKGSFCTVKGSEKAQIAYYVKIHVDWQEHAAQIYKEARDARSLVQTSFFF